MNKGKVNEMKKEYLYEATAINTDGVNGHAYINQEGGLNVEVSSPLNKRPGTNPEELLGLSLSTCFNSTIKAILKEEKLANNSRVEVPVQLKREADDSGYFFEVAIHVAIENLEPELANDVMIAASLRCPVYKLISQSETITLKIVEY